MFPLKTSGLLLLFFQLNKHDSEPVQQSTPTPVAYGSLSNRVQVPSDVPTGAGVEFRAVGFLVGVPAGAGVLGTVGVESMPSSITGGRTYIGGVAGNA